jgi:hypothetical protein
MDDHLLHTIELEVDGKHMEYITERIAHNSADGVVFKLWSRSERLVAPCMVVKKFGNVQLLLKEHSIIKLVWFMGADCC